MKVLSIRQPWAWAIVSGLKPIENRTWQTKFRGDFLIHAGKLVDLEGIKFIRSIGISLPDKLQTGGIIGYGEIIDCVDHYKSEWFFGPCGFSRTTRSYYQTNIPIIRKRKFPGKHLFYFLVLYFKPVNGLLCSE